MASSRAGAPSSSPTTLPWALVAAIGCTANPPAPTEKSADPEAPPAPPKSPAKPAEPQITPPEALPTERPADAHEATPLLDIQIPVDGAGRLHLAARRYGPLRLQRLTRTQLAVRGELALALAGADGQLRRVHNDLADIDLRTVTKIGELQAFGGRWPDRSFLVGWQPELRSVGSPSVWRRVHDDWRAINNYTYENGADLVWQYDLPTPWLTDETVAVRVLGTNPDPQPGDVMPAQSVLVRAQIEVLPPVDTRDIPAPAPASTPLQRDADTPDSVPSPESAAPVLEDSSAAQAPDEHGLLPTTPPEPPAGAPPAAPADNPPTDEPVPAARSVKPAPPPAPAKFPKLPPGLIPLDLTTHGGTAYVLTREGNVLQNSPHPKKRGRWQNLPASGLAKPEATDALRLHGSDSGRLYLLACLAEKPALRRWDGAAWSDEALPSPAVCPTSVAEAADGSLWLATAPIDGNTLWQRAVDGAWTAVALPRHPWPDLAWERWFAYVPTHSRGSIVWERDPPPDNPPPRSPELRASQVVAHGGDVWILAYASIGRATVPHVVLTTRRPAFAIEFPAAGEEGLDAEDTGDEPFDQTCSDPFLRLRDLTAEEHGADLLPALRDALGARPEFADTVLVEALRSDGRRQLGAIWTNQDALDESFGPLGELGHALDKLRPELEPTMLCLIPRVRYGVEVRAR